MSRQNGKADADLDLLSDDEFVALLETEYENVRKSQEPNELEKKKNWQAIEARTLGRKRSRLKTWLSLASAAVIVLSVLPIFLVTGPEQDMVRLKGEPTLPALRVSAYSLSDSGELKPLSHSVHVGETIVFKLGAIEQLVVGLVAAVNSGDLSVRFVSDKLPAGMEQLLERDGRAYGYVVEEQDNELEFCTVGAYTTDQLESVLQTVRDNKNLLRREACVTLYVNK